MFTTKGSKNVAGESPKLGRTGERDKNKGNRIGSNLDQEKVIG